MKVGFITCTSDNRKLVATAFGQDANRLARALEVHPTKAQTDDELRDARHVLSQFEMAVDMRVAAAVASSSDVYAGWMQFAAAMTAVILGVAAGLVTDAGINWELVRSGDLTQLLTMHMFTSLMVGVAAVPVAPIANDLVGALKTAADAVRGRAST